MEKFHQSIEEMQKQEGVRTIKRAHMLGFLDPDLPKRKTGGSPVTADMPLACRDESTG
jgi:hypothetical protein